MLAAQRNLAQGVELRAAHPPAALRQQPEADLAAAQQRALDGQVDLTGRAGQQTAGTGWPPGMLQDDSRELSQALAGKPDAMRHAREAVEAICGAQPAEPASTCGLTECQGKPMCARCRSWRKAEPGELPPLPMHPEPRTYTWSTLEARTIKRYGADCARLALATSPLPPEQVERVMEAVRHYGYLSPIDHDDGAADALAAVRAILEGRV